MLPESTVDSVHLFLFRHVMFAVRMNSVQNVKIRSKRIKSFSYLNSSCGLYACLEYLKYRNICSFFNQRYGVAYGNRAQIITLPLIALIFIGMI